MAVYSLFVCLNIKEHMKLSNSKQRSKIMITKTTKYGVGYETPTGLEEDSYYEMMYEFMDLAKIKGLTVRQAQKLFTDCADIVLYTKL